MEPFKDLKNTAEDLFEHVTEYIEARWNLTVLKTADRIADGVSSLAAVLILAVFGGMVCLFGSIALALWIGEQTGSMAGGFAWVALGYAVLTGILYLVRGQFIKMPVLNAFIRKFYVD
ncbi:MAG: hypothetical protein J7576_00290 [Siphonobacter aquaeclarae]|jgi:hypothetical protein|nr:hypothetical protein [Siphonobacter aquaeclarae]